MTGQDLLRSIMAQALRAILFASHLIRPHEQHHALRLCKPVPAASGLTFQQRWLSQRLSNRAQSCLIVISLFCNCHCWNLFLLNVVRMLLWLFQCTAAA